MARRFRIRHHVNPLKSDFFATGAQPVKVSGRPLEVELGCADAQWLFERAQVVPAFDLLGVEIRRELVEQVNERAQEAELSPRLSAVFANISEDLGRVLPGGSVTRFVINFPDPWFKRRHHKRRLVTGELCAMLWQKLLPGAEVFFQSDVWDVALDAMDVFEAADDRFENVASAWSFLGANPFEARSKREERCLTRDVPVWRMLYRKRRLAVVR
jgi:tRNA (guanine-N7-)-methyltransferase